MLFLPVLRCLTFVTLLTILLRVSIMLNKILHLVKHTLITALPVVAGVVIAGIVLDEVGNNGRLGTFAAGIAQKAKRGLNA
jgi:hypothetical protein